MEAGNKNENTSIDANRNLKKILKPTSALKADPNTTARLRPSKYTYKGNGLRTSQTVRGTSSKSLSATQSSSIERTLKVAFSNIHETIDETGCVKKHSLSGSPMHDKSSENSHSLCQKCGVITTQPSTTILDRPLGMCSPMRAPFGDENEILTRNSGCCGVCCSCFICVFLNCFYCCYLVCPPIPEAITRKLAFHPPIRGKSYTINYVDGNRLFKNIVFASKAYGKSSLKFVPENAKMYMGILENLELFIVKTAYGNYLACVMFHQTFNSISTKHSNTGNAGNDLVVIIAQPNASDMGELPMFQHFFNMRACSDYCFFDYSGYGVSTGRPSERNIYEDLRSVYSRVCQMRPNAKIVLIGLSIGSATCIELASKKPDRLAGLILIAPFTSGCRLFCTKPNRTKPCCFDRFCSVDKAPNIDVPTLLIHGVCDEFVSVEHSVVLKKRLKHAVQPLFIKDATHTDIIDHDAYPEMYKRMDLFLKNELFAGKSSTI